VGTDTQLRGVITDWGGVLTNPIPAVARAWIEAEDIDWDSYYAVMKSWVSQAYDVGVPSPIHALERGECTEAEFERILAARLCRVDGGVVAADGLLRRMFAAAVRVPVMDDLIRTVRRAGLRTALLTNSWIHDEYPRADLAELFDAVVISYEVGMRKPEREIFLHAAQALDLAPAECVFIDDMKANVTAAVGCGMTGVLHTEPAATAAALHDLIGVPAS
jgi:putative hydrolase of the HAD superfamily